MTTQNNPQSSNAPQQVVASSASSTTVATPVAVSPAAPQKRSAMGITSLVLGIIALVSSWMPFINNLSFFLAVLGVIFGIVGIIGVSKGKVGGKGITIAGLILGVVSVAVVLGTQSMYSAAIDEALSNTNVPVSSAASSPSSADSSSASAANTADSSSTSAGSEADASSEKYAVTIDSCTQTTDYKGNPAIVVTYTWTNNSDDATSFLVAVSAKAYQNGVELENAIGAEGNDAQASMKDVKPGATLTVTEAYVLDDTSDVTVECSELISFDNTIFAERTFTL